MARGTFTTEVRLRRAEDWIPVINDNGQSWTATVRQIQGDALRYAAGISGELHRVHLLALADELETPGYSVPTPKL